MMKKRLSIVAIIVLVAVLMVCLVGCNTGDPIEFSTYGRVEYGTGDKYDAGHFVVSMFTTYDDFYEYAATLNIIEPATVADSEDDEDGRPSLNAAFFEEYNMIAIEHGAYQNESYEIKKVTIKDSTLTVKYNRTYTESLLTYTYIDFIYVQKTLVENVTECKATASSMSISFG